MNKGLLALSALTAAAITPTTASAAPIITSFTPSRTSVGGIYNVGYQFRADTNKTITQLGFYDANGDGLASSHEVALFALNGTKLGSVTVGAGGTLIGNFRYANLASAIDLVAGTSYRLTGTTAGTDAWVVQANSPVTSDVTYQGSYYTSNDTSSFPNILVSTAAYFVVNAADTVITAAVPEPATWAMMLVGFGMISATARYRRRGTKIAYA